MCCKYSATDTTLKNVAGLEIETSTRVVQKIGSAVTYVAYERKFAGSQFTEDGQNFSHAYVIHCVGEALKQTLVGQNTGILEKCNIFMTIKKITAANYYFYLLLNTNVQLRLFHYLE